MAGTVPKILISELALGMILPMRYVSRREMQAIDQAASLYYNLPSGELMENAGRASANYFCSVIQNPQGSAVRVLCLCGKGNNGGDALVTARYLIQKKFQISVLLLEPPGQMTAESRTQWQKIRDLAPDAILEPHEHADLAPLLNEQDYVIDGLFGIGLSRPLKGTPLEWIRAVNQSRRPVLALDIPSGMDADTGSGLPECICASWTITYGLPKKAFQNPAALSKTGFVFVANIGFPPPLLK